VVICTYQRPHLLPRAIQSVLSQSFRDFELLIVDDASSESARPVVSAYQDDRIRFFRNSENRGFAHSTNLAFREARGELITTLDDDDEFEPSFLDETDRHFRSQDVAFCWCGIREFSSPSAEPRERLVKLASTDLRDRQMVAVLIGSGFGFAFRRDCLERVGGYDENLEACTDVDFFLKMVQGPWGWSCLPKILVQVHVQPQRMTRQNTLCGKSLEYIVKKHQDFLDDHPRIRSILYSQLGTILADAGERLWVRRTLSGYLRQVPGDIRVWTVFLSNELRYSRLGMRLLKIYRWFYHRYFG
jgi:glycosyltransferase involved in cell wall biosynthesis